MESLPRHILRAIRDNLRLLALLAAAMAAIDIFIGQTSQGSSFAIQCILVYTLHRQILFGMPINWLGQVRPPAGVALPKERMGRFVLISLLFTAVAVLPPLIAAFMLIPNGPDAVAIRLGTTVLGGVTLMWLLLSAAGTILLATASALPLSPGRAWQAGRKTGLRVAMQLLLFPGLYTLLLIAVNIFVLGPLLPQNMEKAASYGYSAAFVFMGSLSSVMTVVILVRAFQRAYPKDQMPDVDAAPVPL
ncbi:MAG: hypothetical protein QM656_11735 [Paracoccaceae bacterium]